LGLENRFQEGDSSHVLGGVYYSASVLGVAIKLESNSYDYDDKYAYMIGVKEQLLSDLNVEDSIITSVTQVIITLLIVNLKIQVAHEVTEGEFWL
jgi:hypothetical protein